MMAPEAAILVALAIPFGGAALVALTGRRPGLRDGITLATASAMFAAVVSLLPSVLEGARPAVSLVEVIPGLALAFAVEPLGMLFALVASGLWIANSLYSIGYMRANGEAKQTRFYVCFALALAATLGIAFAANVFTLFLFYELLTLITYPLVTHHGTEQARLAGRVYLGVLLGTSVCLLLPAVVATWHVAGTTDFRSGGILEGRLSAPALAGLLALYVLGIGKAAVMPVHRWLPAAMVAPTPVSALLHAVAVVKAGVFAILKIGVYVFGAGAAEVLRGMDWLPLLAAFTIIAASIVALRSDNLKRRLAYSTVSQLSYVVLAAALLTPLSIIGAALHIATHALGKITLFFAAGAIYTAAHKTEVSQLAGIARRMPWTMAAFTVGALSLIGVPPAAGFVSKWFIFTGAVAGEHYLVLAVLIGATLLNAAYFLPIVHAAYFRNANAVEHVQHGEAPWPMVAALVLTAGATLALFLVADVPLALARQVASGFPG
jgi:multicomponent Na+:H+ antiporter subunit D